MSPVPDIGMIEGSRYSLCFLSEDPKKEAAINCSLSCDQTEVQMMLKVAKAKEEMWSVSERSA